MAPIWPLPRTNHSIIFNLKENIGDLPFPSYCLGTPDWLDVAMTTNLSDIYIALEF